MRSYPVRLMASYWKVIRIYPVRLMASYWKVNAQQSSEACSYISYGKVNRHLSCEADG